MIREHRSDAPEATHDELALRRQTLRSDQQSNLVAPEDDSGVVAGRRQRIEQAGENPD